MPFVDTGELVVHVAAYGPADAATTLVFANSLGTDFRIWDQVRDRLMDRVGPDLRLVFMDKRGHGLTEMGPSTSLAGNVADMAAVLDHLGAARVVVCGLSVGGQIALGYAAAHADRLAGLILCDTAHKIGSPEMWQARIDTVRDKGIAVLADPILERWFGAGFRNGRPVELAGYRTMLIRTPAEGYARMCETIRDTDLTDAARTVAVPTLVMVGSEDGSTPPALVAEMAALIPGAELHTIPGAGHLPCIEDPDLVARLIAGHLDRIRQEDSQ